MTLRVAQFEALFTNRTSVTGYLSQLCVKILLPLKYDFKNGDARFQAH